MTLIDEQTTVAEARLQFRLRAAGAVALAAAALGSVWSASSLAAVPTGNQDCVMDLAAATGFSSGCDEARTPASAP
ncbi:hypothetical protein [Nocardioides zeicaulis]|uniref:Uncharacterized protein n=1 Tax=Nocardioides zeicaulis TaxID=1776857 RepID=A0ABV6DYU0_9ACTN